jgi:ribosomal protein L11 methylase PrmA
MYKNKKHHCQDHKMKTILHNVLYNPAQNLVYTHIHKIHQYGNILTSGIIEIWGGTPTKIINYCCL